MPRPSPRDADTMAGDVHFFAAMARSTFLRGKDSDGTVSPRLGAVGPLATDRPGGREVHAGGADSSRSSAARVGPTCPVTVYAPVRGPLDVRAYRWRPCGRDVAADGLCRQHAEDRDRLAARI